MRRRTLLLLLLYVPLLRASAASIVDEVRAADNARVRATMRGDVDALASLLSSELHYGHYSGQVDTKEQYVADARTSQMTYEGYDYIENVITPVTADVALMTGRTRFHVRTGEEREEVVVQFLMVWKKENGAWHLFAHQSTHLPELESPVTAGAKTK